MSGREGGEEGRSETNHISDSPASSEDLRAEFLFVAVAQPQTAQSSRTLCDGRLLTARYDLIFISQWWFFCIEDIIYRIYICWRMTVTQADLM